MNQLILIAAWGWISIGLICGAIIGLKFYQAEWMGGYASWPRRMMRLGHIAFIGTSLLLIGLVASSHAIGMGELSPVTGIFGMVGAFSMPVVCYLSAYQMSFRHLFPIPVVGLIVAAISFLIDAIRFVA